MIQQFSTLKYFIYARKSSESDEKQVQSIEDQIGVLTSFAKAAQIHIVDILTEARSGKEPNDRPVFESLLKRIQKGEANGIVVWKVDRLSRNPIDGAKVQWLLQKGILQSIRTPDREYRPEDNVLVLNVESSMATQYILDLSKNVRRGLKSKIAKGWRPSLAPLGYLNTRTELRGENYITNDPLRFSTVQKAWQLMLTGNYLPTTILRIANTEWGLRTRQLKNSGGTMLSRASIYRIFTNIFYAGIIDTYGIYVQGKHEAMITIDEFDHVQMLLGKKGKPRRIIHEYAYNGLLKCGDCDGTISATYKEKIIKTTGMLKGYSLYYCFCARKKKNACQQLTYTNADTIDQTIIEFLAFHTISPLFRDWVLKVIDEMADVEAGSDTNSRILLETTTEKLNKQLYNLTQMRMKDMIDDIEFLTEKKRLSNEITILQSKLLKEPSQEKGWVKQTKDAFEFVFHSLSRFQNGTPQTKREIASGLSSGLNWTLKDKILNIIKPKWIQSIKNSIDLIESSFDQFELEKILTTKDQNEHSAAVSLALRGLVDDVRTDLETYPPEYTIPKLQDINSE